MTAQEFFNLPITHGDKVNVSLSGGGKIYTGIYGGIKCYDGIHATPEYGIFPVFYREAKNGGIVRRSIFGDNHYTHIGLSDLQSITRVPIAYRYRGCFEGALQCHNLAIRGYHTAVHAWKSGQGKFSSDNGETIHEDFRPDKCTTMVDNARYAVRYVGIDKLSQRDIEDIDNGVLQEDSLPFPCRIEIYERIRES